MSIISNETLKTLIFKEWQKKLGDQNNLKKSKNCKLLDTNLKYNIKYRNNFVLFLEDIAKIAKICEP